MPTTSKSPESVIEDAVGSLRGSAQHSLDAVIGHAREKPQEALLYALGTGYALRMLPTLGILRGVFRLALRLVKPGLVVFALAELWHVTHKNGAGESGPGS